MLQYDVKLYIHLFDSYFMAEDPSATLAVRPKSLLCIPVTVVVSVKVKRTVYTLKPPWIMWCIL